MQRSLAGDPVPDTTAPRRRAARRDRTDERERPGAGVGAGRDGQLRTVTPRRFCAQACSLEPGTAGRSLP